MSWQSKYERVPFVEKGRVMDGADCWGLVRIILKEERGIDLPDYLGVYNEDFKKWSQDERTALEEIMKAEADQKWQEVTRPQPFDVILMKMKGFATHVGIVIDRQRMIHCQEGIGTSIEKFNSIRWSDNVVGFYRWVN